MATTASVQPPFETRGPQLEAVAIFFLSMALTSFALRVFVRLRMVKAFGWDDWLMGCATLAFSAYIVCVLAGVHFGTGKHFADISTADGEKALEVRHHGPDVLGECMLTRERGTVLVLLLRVVHMDDDAVQAVDRCLPPANRCSAPLGSLCGHAC